MIPATAIKYNKHKSKGPKPNVLLVNDWQVCKSTTSKTLFNEY